MRALMSEMPARRRVHPAIVALAGVAMAAGCVLAIALVAATSAPHQSHANAQRSHSARSQSVRSSRARRARPRLAVLARSPTPRAAAYQAAHSLPADAVRAEMFGSAEVYVSEQPHRGEICLSVIEGALGGTACSRAGDVQQHGLIDVRVESGRVRVGALVPDGVKTVTLRDRNGAVRRVKVTGNVAEVYDGNVASVRYELPDGSTRIERIPPAVLKPSPPPSRQQNRPPDTLTEQAL